MMRGIAKIASASIVPPFREPDHFIDQDPKSVKVRVEIYENMDTLDHYESLREYVVDYDDPVQRRVLAEQCRNAFAAGQFVLTYPASAAPSGTTSKIIGSGAT